MNLMPTFQGDPAVAAAMSELSSLGIQVQVCGPGTLPPEAMLHDRAAQVPAVVVSPKANGAWP